MTVDIPTTPRKAMSWTKRLRIFEAAKGRCHVCEQKIFGKEWEVEHVIPLALGGNDEESNMRPAHTACHAKKTRADNAAWTKAKRVKAKHVGAAKKRSTFACARTGKYKQKIGGRTELR